MMGAQGRAIGFATVATREPSPAVSAIRRVSSYRKGGG
jgi:hypothetical protein